MTTPWWYRQSVCSPTTGVWREQFEGPFHVYLDEPLGERRVIDALTGREVPYKDIWAEIAAEEAAEADERRRSGGGRHAIGLSGLSPLRSAHGAVSIHEAKTHFSRLVARAEAGEEIVVRRGPTPVAKIVAYHAPTTPRVPGALKGRITIADDFDETPDEFAEYTA